MSFRLVPKSVTFRIAVQAFWISSCWSYTIGIEPQSQWSEFPLSLDS